MCSMWESPSILAVTFIRYGKHGHMNIAWQIENRPLFWLQS